ncbi:hypothetical protein MSAN_00680500 [Mycena sanguinolenta]|uniref:BTB domain-containing protein n=1 Tax=Mycena sanguinolenta TaxID=230812 RepID=A0A8H6Z451_9AGAR|nr:hypothetical protein MSAN_00680500 [Mycena sanguinolenta]
MADAAIIYNTETPFTHDAADIIVRSMSDNVDFPVQKAFLAAASVVFQDMFSLPQNESHIGSGFSAGNMKNGLHIMTLDEDEETLGTLLRMCYPRWMVIDCEPLFPTLEHTLAVFTAAKKYAMDGVEREVRAVLVAPRFIEQNPLRAFALVMRDNLYDEAKTCARYTLRTPILSKVYMPELEYITAGAYYRLQKYHVLCGIAAEGVSQDLRWITNESGTWFECALCRGNSVVGISGDRRKWVAKWWADFMVEAKNALRERPCGATVGIGSEVVQMAIEKANVCVTCRSKVFREMFQFCTLFSAEVEKAIDTVEVEFGAPLG